MIIGLGADFLVCFCWMGILFLITVSSLVFCFLWSAGEEGRFCSCRGLNFWQSKCSLVEQGVLPQLWNVIWWLGRPELGKGWADKKEVEDWDSLMEEKHTKIYISPNDI